MAKAPSAGRSSGNVVRALTRSPMADHHLIVFATVILTAIGEMMVLSSSSVLALVQGESPYYYMIRQLIFLVVGLLLMIPVSRMKPETLRKLAAPAWAAAVLGLILVQTPLGYETNGNRNWIRIGGLLTIQPSEFAKLVLVLWAAALFHNKRRRLKEPAQLLLPFIPGALALLGLILAWIQRNGGLAGMAERNRAKARLLYDYIDGSGFYTNPVAGNARSWMNVPFLTPDPELDKVFPGQAAEAGLTNLAGHRSVGGMRASIYNAMPLAGVQALIEFMQEFARVNG